MFQNVRSTALSLDFIDCSDAVADIERNCRTELRSSIKTVRPLSSLALATFFSRSIAHNGVAQQTMINPTSSKQNLFRVNMIHLIARFIWKKAEKHIKDANNTKQNDERGRK